MRFFVFPGDGPKGRAPNWGGGATLEYSLDENQLDSIEKKLRVEVVDLGVHCVCLIDVAGNILVDLDNGKDSFDVYSLAALAAGNYGAVDAIATIIGEEEFSLLFHKGKNRSIYFHKILQNFLLVIIFGNETSLGHLRLKVAAVAADIEKTLNG